MRTTAVLLFLGLFTTALVGAMPAPASAQYGEDARIWVENDRDYFRHGDRLRVRFSTSASSYVAVVHVDPDGYLEFLYPGSPWDEEFVRGGRIHTLDRTGWGNGLLVRGGSGIGYLYVIASPVPLDYSRFQAGRGFGWDWSYAGRRIAGDPFWAMEQLTRMLVPGGGSVPYAVDYYTYYVGGRHAYPRYACASYSGGWGWGYSPGWASYYGACNRLDRFVRDNPYYFDSQRYRGDRWRYYRDYRDWDPRHGYKEDPRQPSARSGARAEARPDDGVRSRAMPRSSDPVMPSSRPVQRAAPERPAPVPAPARAAPRDPERSAPSARPRNENDAPDRARPVTRSRPEPRSTGSASGRRDPAPATRAASPSSRSSGSSEREASSSTPRSRRGD